MARTKKKSIHYVDNAKFLEAMKEWKDQCKDAEETGDEKPRISNYIGECFLKIANGLSYRPNFINYTYKQESDNLRMTIAVNIDIHEKE